MATSSLIQHHAAASISLAAAHPADSSTGNSGSSTSSNSGATISANDFLTLLVTEMQNQDPTADTDPNEYINQLVQVNSLEQLIQINQTLSSAVPTPSSGATPSSSFLQSPEQKNGNPSSNSQAQSAQLHPASPAGASLQSNPLSGVPAAMAAPIESGNLSAPAPSPAALRIAQTFGASRTQP